MYLSSLQILRALAAISVVYFHISNSNFKFGSYGVDIFFVISGFVMATVITNGQSSTTFIKNRLLRIIPLYWILTSALLFITFLKPDLLNSTSFNLYNYIKSLLFIPYFKENGALHPMLTVGWSLNYEMFFYFTIWFSITFFRKIWAIMTCLLIALFHYQSSFFFKNSAYLEFFNNTIIMEFCLGLLSYYLYGWLKNKKVNFNTNLIIAFITLCFCIMIYAELMHYGDNRFIFYGLPSFFIVLVSVLFESYRQIKRNIWVIIGLTLGESSYALYLSHTFCVEALKKIVFPTLGLTRMPSALTISITMLFSILIGYLIFLYIDKPITKFLKNHLVK